jgi:UDP-N-acetyl-D-mannosaminuronate dehydrogenase
MKHLIIGMGEVGMALSHVLKKEKLQVRDLFDNNVSLPIDMLHICIPYSETFVEVVKDYIEEYKPKHTIIYSSVPVGTTRQIGENVAHSPVEGIHPKLVAGFRNFTRWIGSTSVETTEACADFWIQYVSHTRATHNPDHTEFLKLYSTSKYGINIVFADYANNVAKHLGMDYEQVKHYDQDYNKLYTRIQRNQYKRYILDPPDGKIGGHCIVPNAELLSEQYPNEQLTLIMEMK